jgi:uncharacterized membrane protein
MATTQGRITGNTVAITGLALTVLGVILTVWGQFTAVQQKLRDIEVERGDFARRVADIEANCEQAINKTR